jgi:hypothetical protein
MALKGRGSGVSSSSDVSANTHIPAVQYLLDFLAPCVVSAGTTRAPARSACTSDGTRPTRLHLVQAISFLGVRNFLGHNSVLLDEALSVI